MNPALPGLALLAISLLVLFVVGSALRHRYSANRLESKVTRVEQDVATFNEKLRHDPQRAGIDMGKRYAANEMQATIDRLRQEESR